jgi:hypothetical protein
MTHRTGREQGNALLAAITLTIMVFALGYALLSEVVFRSKTELALRRSDEALRLCDTGLEQARRWLWLYRNTNAWPWNDILAYNQGLSTDARTWKAASLAMLRAHAESPTSANRAASWPEAPVPAGSLTVPATVPTYFGIPAIYGQGPGAGAFVIVVRNNPEDAGGPLSDTDGQLAVFITATMQDGIQRQVEARLRFEPPLFVPAGAVISGGTARIWGNMTVEGTGAGAGNANIISNANVEFGGNAHVDGKVIAFGSVITDGSAQATNGTAEGAGRFALPDADPARYRPLAPYVFHSDGRVEQVGLGTIAIGTWKGWTYDVLAGMWTSSIRDGSMPYATYYFEGSIRLSGQAWINGTAIVEGNVELHGQGASVPSIVSSLGNVAILAGGDIFANGAVTLTGTVIAREQVRLNGNFTITGSIISVNEFDHSQLVSTTDSYENILSGSARIIFPGGHETFLPTDAAACTLVFVRRTY